MDNPRGSDKKVLDLGEITEPIRVILMGPNDSQPELGPCVTLQINNDKVSYPINKEIPLTEPFYKLLKNLEKSNRNFFKKIIGNYDMVEELKNYEPKVSKI
jgi:hypothetical protein